VVIAALAVIVGIAIDAALARLAAYCRSSGLSWIGIILVLVVWFGVPIVEYQIVVWGTSFGPAFGSATVTFVGGYVILDRLLKDRRSSWDKRELRKERAARDRAWLMLDRQQRAAVRRLARRSELHPDPIVAAIVSHWAEGTALNDRGPRIRLARRITAIGDGALQARRSGPTADPPS
jgi:hypothetical protein